MKKGRIRRGSGTGSLQREPTGIYTIRAVINGQRFAKTTRTRDYDEALKKLEENPKGLTPMVWFEWWG